LLTTNKEHGQLVVKALGISGATWGSSPQEICHTLCCITGVTQKIAAQMLRLQKQMCFC